MYAFDVKKTSKLQTRLFLSICSVLGFKGNLKGGPDLDGIELYREFHLYEYLAYKIFEEMKKPS